MNRRHGTILLSMVLAATVSIVACIGPAERAQMEDAIQLEHQAIAEAETSAAQKLGAALEKLAEAETEADLDEALAALAAVEPEIAELATRTAAAEERLAVKERELAEAKAGGLLDVASTFWPQLALLSPVVLGIAGVFSGRYREHAGNALKAVVGKSPDGNGISGLLTSLAKAYGLAHTSSDPAALAKVASKLVDRQKALTPAERDALLAELEGLRAKAATKAIPGTAVPGAAT